MKRCKHSCCDWALLVNVFIILSCLLLHSSYSLAQEAAETPAGWDFQPKLSVKETYIDNVRLGGVGGGFGGGGFGSVTGDKQDDFVSQINPSVALTGRNSRFDINASYLMNNLFFAKNGNFNRTRHQLRAKATTVLLKDLFFVDGIASIRQQNASIFGAQTTDNLNITGNRRDVRVYTLSPYLRHRFKGFASAEIRYTYGIVESSAGGLRNSNRNTYEARLNSGNYFRTLSWGANYSHQSIHIDGSNARPGRTIELERSIGNLRYNITPRFALTATGGYERNSFISIRGKPSSPTWSVGFTWMPSERTDVSFTVGKRFFGDTYSASAKHRTRLTTWQAKYSEDVTTFNQQAGGGGFGGDGGLNAFPGSGFLGSNNFLTNRLFLQRRGQASVTINGSRNSLSFRIFTRSRRALSPEVDDVELLGAQDVSALNNTRQLGGNASWNYKLSSRTTASFTASYIRFKFLSGNSGNKKTDNKIFTASLEKRFEENLKATFLYRFIQRTIDSKDVSANAVTASLSMDF